MDIYQVILYLNNSLLVICTLIGILKYKVFRNTEKWYVYYIIFLFLIEATGRVSINLFNAKDLNFLFPYYVSGDFLILGILFIRKLALRWYWYIPVVILAGFFLVDTEIISNEIKKVISNIVVICFAGYALLMEIKNTKINDRFMAVDSLIFLYYGLSVFLFFLLRQLADFGKEEAGMIWSINNLLCSFLYLSIIYTFLKLKK
ncbi:hypothetical protein J3D55_004126 [Chryseobacterium ginsenosidimutans]|uniref:hypothetical protein n=1 Tax=Chryseobacterium ginsenosidimutans TaxID=687846 RepID=UPI002167B538|nr:hypothetical protein [Chryseobacterium ginsenosidimutans]MCS3871210.1 hypothetical protein [Chryseobacterium ginsenosidimutans]